MIEANEISSTFYALRLLSHGLDTSQIQVIDGEEYPASEFTREEQEQALKINHSIEESEPVPFGELSPDKIDFYLTALSDRIEELANNDLSNAGYTLGPPGAPFLGEPLSSVVAAEALATQELDLALAEINPQLRRIFELHYLQGYRIQEIAEMTDCSGKAIRVMLHRAKKRLRQALKQERLPHNAANRT